MKKNIFTILLAAVVLVSLSGCSEYLNRVPLDSNSDATNWSSESAIETYSWNLYGDLSGLSYGSGWTRGLMMASCMGVLMGRKLLEKGL